MLEDQEGQASEVSDWTQSEVTGVQNAEADVASLRGGVGFCWVLGAVGCGKCKLGGQ